MPDPDHDRIGGTRLENFARTAEFWRRSSGIYAAYKLAQVKAWALRKQGWDKERLTEKHWRPHHTWAGNEFHKLAVDLRGFYLKLGQFFAARAEFVPEPICRKLALLHDQVPPMSPEQTRVVVQGELGGTPLEDVFEWLDLETPLGSASIAQVHKGKLRGDGRQKQAHRQQKPPWWTLGFHALSFNSAAGWESANCANEELGTKRMPLRKKLGRRRSRTGAMNTVQRSDGPAKAAADAAVAADGPPNGIVAVKVQYPGSLPTMMLDLTHIRVFANYLRHTEIKFDLLSAVDELASQVRMEFDFVREASVMDSIADHLKGMSHAVEIPRSVPGLVTPRLLVMNYVPGTQIMRLKGSLQSLSPWQRDIAKQRILRRVTDAYGHMLLVNGLFQADAHPGNILVQPGGRIGLLDYGQSKQLPEHVRLSLAKLMLELGRGQTHARRDVVAKLLHEMGLRFSRPADDIQTMMAFGMFDSQLSHRVDPFSPDSPIKKLEIQHFPPDVFFVLRVVQLLRGLAGGMQVKEFSTARQWSPYAKQALKQPKRRRSLLRR